MDGKGRLGVRNWEFSGQCMNLEPALKTLLEAPSSQNLMSHHQATFLKMSGYQDRSLIAEPEIPTLDFAWGPQRNFLSVTKPDLDAVQQNLVSPEISGMQRFLSSGNDDLQSSQIESKPKKSRKRHPSEKKAAQGSSDALKTDHHKKQSPGLSKKKNTSTSIGTREKKNLDIVYEGITFDFSSVPAPVCSCTGVPRQCYRWGAGGWQSSCCTTTISEYPLPMSTSRPGARVAGRKMSIGAYGKLLQRLATEGQDLSQPVDLKNHWARHGTNKFVTIR